MEKSKEDNNLELPPTGIFELPGEPAVVINGVPPASLSEGTLFYCKTVNDTESHKNTKFGDWLIGRGVHKLFGGQLYNGKVREFDKESGWYRAVYEDGDFEDLEWHELQEILLPLDITVPLKALASKVIKKRQKQIHKPARSVSKFRGKKISGKRGKENVDMIAEASSMSLNNGSFKTSENVQHLNITEYVSQGWGTTNL